MFLVEIPRMGLLFERGYNRDNGLLFGAGVYDPNVSVPTGGGATTLEIRPPAMLCVPLPPSPPPGQALKARQTAAAAVIQRLWRGFAARRTVELQRKVCRERRSQSLSLRWPSPILLGASTTNPGFACAGRGIESFRHRSIRGGWTGWGPTPTSQRQRLSKKGGIVLE